MTDAEVLHLFLQRERRWSAVLHDLREFHVTHIGKEVTPVTWMPGSPTMGTHGWFGYYWRKEIFWFGYGLRGGSWLPLIESDRRSAHSESWNTLRQSLPQAWEVVDADSNAFARLWAPVDLDEDDESQRQWFRERSLELHEFAIGR